jgi:hypothetical protein
MTAVDEATASRDRRRSGLAAAIAVAGTACCAAALVLSEVVGVEGSASATPAEYVLGTAWPVVGALIVRGQPRNPVGWLMLIPALIGPYLLAALYAAYSSGAGVLGAFCAWYATWGFAPFFFTMPVLPHLFPDGRPLSPRWGKVFVGVVAVAAVTTVARMFASVDRLMEAEMN